MSLNNFGQSTSCSCCTSEHQNFNFWLGDWNVYSNDKLAGTNSIILAQDSCLLIENWVGSGATTGTSMNFFNSVEKNWNQLWIDSNGNILKLKGNFYGKSMVLISDPSVNSSGNIVLNRIKWTPNDDGTVRQLWEGSKDGGQNWSIIFDGNYVRKG